MFGLKHQVNISYDNDGIKFGPGHSQKTFFINYRKAKKPKIQRFFDVFKSNFRMSLVGSWKRVKVDNGMAFGKAIGATEAQLASSANAVSTVTYTITGNNVKVERCHKYDGKELVSCFHLNFTLIYPQRHLGFTLFHLNLENR